MKIKDIYPLWRGVCLLAICSLGLQLSSCRKLIEIDLPTGSLVEQKVFNNDADVAAVLAGIYSTMGSDKEQLSGTNGGISLYAGMSSDELLNYVGSANPIDYIYRSNSLYADSAATERFWTAPYRAIFSANALLEGVAKATSSRLTDSVTRQATGEAKFLRAFNYFYLVNLFGDVPLVLGTDFNETSKMDRTDKAKVYAQIIQDLQEAEEQLPEGYNFVPDKERVRANRAAASALLARTYLYLERWQEAADAASKVIADANYELLPDLKQVFLKNSREAIFQLSVETDKEGQYLLHEANLVLPPMFWSEFPEILQLSYLSSVSDYQSIENFIAPGYYLSPAAAAAFEEGDQRKAIWTSRLDRPNVAPYDGQAIYFPFKYTVKPSLLNGFPQYEMVLRLAEQYLIRAEAYAHLGREGEALADINMVRSRAGLEPSKASGQQALLAAVAQERRVELFAEWGHRWFDLKRTGKASEVLGAITEKQPWDDRQLLYPIPPMEIRNDPYLDQNPGY